MPIPEYDELLEPVKRILGKTGTTKKEEIIRACQDEFQASPEERRKTTAGGKLVFRSKVSRAISKLIDKGVVERVSTGYFRLQQKDYTIEAPPAGKIVQTTIQSSVEQVDYEEMIEAGHSRLRLVLSERLIEKIFEKSPAFFESLVVKLLVKLGYGGSEKDAGQTIGRSGDGGVDGIIKQDPLGLDIMCVQAKRWKNVVGASEIRNFIGSLDAHRTRKGVFITTSNFTSDAIKCVETAGDKKVKLIDGKHLTDLMIENDVGVSADRIYTIKRIDSDFFEEE